MAAKNLNSNSPHKLFHQKWEQHFPEGIFHKIWLIIGKSKYNNIAEMKSEKKKHIWFCFYGENKFKCA